MRWWSVPFVFSQLAASEAWESHGGIRQNGPRPYQAATTDLQGASSRRSPRLRSAFQTQRFRYNSSSQPTRLVLRAPREEGNLPRNGGLTVPGQKLEAMRVGTEDERKRGYAARAGKRGLQLGRVRGCITDHTRHATCGQTLPSLSQLGTGTRLTLAESTEPATWCGVELTAVTAARLENRMQKPR